MRFRVLMIFLLISACGESAPPIPTPPELSVVAASDPDPRRGDIKLSDHFVAPDRVLRTDENALELRDRLVEEILVTHPELADDPVLLPSLKGEAPWIVLSVPEQYAGIAPKIARAYQLLDLTRKERRAP